jgi:hypothetical protein
MGKLKVVYNVIKSQTVFKKGLLKFMTTGVNLGMWLREISQTQKD